MRTKTLLLSAAALLAGLLSTTTQAQNVYSANVVGYYNLTVPSGAYFFFANQLTNAGNNANTILTNGMASDANGSTNTVLYYWNGTGYNSYQYFNGPDADSYFLGSGSPNGWYDAVGNNVQPILSQGSGSYIYNPSAAALHPTLVGQVPQGTNNITIQTGFNTYCIVPPVVTNIDASLIGTYPGTSDANGQTNDVYYFFNGTGYNAFQYFTGADADSYFLGSGSASGFYDAVGNNVSQNPAYYPKVGVAFFIQHYGAPKTWVQSFNVQ